MEIRDTNNLLKRLQSVLEELDQNAAGPELGDTKQLDNEATDERDAKVDDLEKASTDVYPDDEHEQVEELEPVEITESEQNAAGPELGEGDELKNEATDEKKPETDDLEKASTDVYPDDEHEQVEELEPIDISEELELEDSVSEDIVTEPTPDATGEDKLAPVISDDSDEIVDTKDTTDELEKILDTKPAEDNEGDSALTESMNKIFNLIRQINEEVEAQNAAGPELGEGDELKNEATDEKKPETDDLEKASTDVYPDDEHEQVEELEPVEITEGITKTDDATKNRQLGNADLKRMRREIEKLPVDSKERKEAEEFLKKNKAVYMAESEQNAAGPELGDTKQLDNEATDEKTAKFDDLEKASTDIYPDDEHEQVEELEPVEITEGITKTDDLANERKTSFLYKSIDSFDDQKCDKLIHKIFSNKKIVDAFKEKNTTEDEIINLPLERKKEMIKRIVSRGKNYNNKTSMDVINAENKLKAEENALKESVIGGIGKIVGGITASVALLALNILMGLFSGWILLGPIFFMPAILGVTSGIKDIKDSIDNNRSVNITESEQNAAGPELGDTKQLDNEATDEKAPETMSPDIKSTDVFDDESHKQVEEIVGVVVEAMKRCKGQRMTKSRLCEEVEKILIDRDFDKKEYDADADIESSEMNGSDTAFDCYDKIQGEGSEAAKDAEVKPSDLMTESVRYNSLREACLLDEDYFKVDSYRIESSEEKINKLTEQLSLLIARDAQDPLYDELLKEAHYCQKLTEACKQKYGKTASIKAKNIIN